MSCHPTCLSSDNVPGQYSSNLQAKFAQQLLNAVDDADSINSRLIYKTVLNGTGEQVFEWFPITKKIGNEDGFFVLP